MLDMLEAVKETMPTSPTTSLLKGKSQTANLGLKYNPVGQASLILVTTEYERGGEYVVYRKRGCKELKR